MATIIGALLWAATRLFLFCVIVYLSWAFFGVDDKTHASLPNAKIMPDLEDWLNANKLSSPELSAALLVSGIRSLDDLLSIRKTILDSVVDSLKAVQRKKFVVCLENHILSVVAATKVRDIVLEPLILSRGVSLEADDERTSTVDGFTYCLDCGAVVDADHKRCESCSKSGRVYHTLRDVTLDPNEPKWNNVTVEEALLYPMVFPSLNDILSVGGMRATAHFPQRERCQVKVGSNPYCQTSNNCALYHGQQVDGHKVIVRELLYESNAFRGVGAYDELLLSWQTAAVLATEYNRIKPVSFSLIRYANASILQFMARFPEQPFMVLTAKPPGNYEKYNNNAGYVAPNPTLHDINHKLIQAFSHWTYDISNGSLLVVDCQGGFDTANNCFVLTDPVVHCNDLSRFGAANMGNDGMKSFFTSHECGDCCRGLGLQPVDISAFL